MQRAHNLNLPVRVSEKPVEKELLYARDRLIDSSGPSAIICLSAQFTFTAEVLLLTEPAGGYFWVNLRTCLFSACHASVASQASISSAAASELSQVDWLLFLFFWTTCFIRSANEKMYFNLGTEYGGLLWVLSSWILFYISGWKCSFKHTSLFPLFPTRDVELSCQISGYVSSRSTINWLKCSLKSLVSFTIKQA